MLADPRFSNVKYHAVAGAYGIQEGLYVPPNDLFKIAFGTNGLMPTQTLSKL